MNFIRFLFKNSENKDLSSIFGSQMKTPIINDEPIPPSINQKPSSVEENKTKNSNEWTVKIAKVVTAYKL